MGQFFFFFLFFFSNPKLFQWATLKYDKLYLLNIYIFFFLGVILYPCDCKSFEEDINIGYHALPCFSSFFVCSIRLHIGAKLNATLVNAKIFPSRDSHARMKNLET